ncbi:unnamed protein product [Brassicogethes aeneus]|uniref:Uncharacterized protein n=1 Tax=Brassicogethes aeneus TaxID=1431903 RepID=A0A9P0B3P2_BRAAE|nr:unnamed protein product [Brassicogethes aeneus]
MKDNYQLSSASSSRIQDHTEMLKENDTIDLENEGSTVVSDSDKIVTIGDHFLIKWGTSKYPGEVLSVFEDGLMVRCMKQGVKFWRWPYIKDEQLYKWEDVIQKIKPPKRAEAGPLVNSDGTGRGGCANREIPVHNILSRIIFADVRTDGQDAAGILRGNNNKRTAEAVAVACSSFSLIWMQR